MTTSDAMDYAQITGAQDSILSGTDFFKAIQRSTEFAKALRQPGEPPKSFGFGTIFHGALGAAMGAGIARGVSSVLGLPDRFSDKLETAAMGIGAAMNTGILKRSNAETEVRHAFRLGFAKAASDKGLLKEAGLVPIPVFSVSPTDLINIPKGVMQAAGTGASALGTAAGTFDAINDDEEELTKMQVEKTLLQERLNRVIAEKKNNAVRRLLAQRK